MYTTMTPGSGGSSNNDSDNPLVFPNVVAGTTTITTTLPSGKTCTPQAVITNYRVDPATFSWVQYNCQ
jgi:hypothetical protein